MVSVPKIKNIISVQLTDYQKPSILMAVNFFSSTL